MIPLSPTLTEVGLFLFQTLKNGEIPYAVGGKFPDRRNRLYTDLRISISGYNRKWVGSIGDDEENWAKNEKLGRSKVRTLLLRCGGRPCFGSAVLRLFCVSDNHFPSCSRSDPIFAWARFGAGRFNFPEPLPTSVSPGEPLKKPLPGGEGENPKQGFYHY